MKKRNILTMAALLFGMTLAACGAKPTPSSEEKPIQSSDVTPTTSEVQPSSEDQKPSSENPQPSSESQQPSSEVPVTKSVTLSSVNLVSKEGKVYLQLEGTVTGYTAAEFKWAFALSATDNDGAASTNFIVGTSAEFQDADFTLDATINADGTYVFEYNLSDIAGLTAGLYTIHARVKGQNANLAVGQVNNGATLKDGTYRFYIRPDVGQKNTIAVDALPPVALAEASIVTDDDGKIWAKIGGETTVTQETLDAYDSFVQFQQVGGSWTNTKRTKAAGQYYWKVEGEKAYLYADVSFFAAGNNYNTHLNVTTNVQADCKMDAAINEHYVVKNGGKWLDINVISIPGASAQSDFWGNLGFAVTKGENPNPAHVLNPVEHTAGEGETAVEIGKCKDDDGYYEISWNAQATTAKNGFDANGKLSGNGTGYAEYKVYSPEALTARLYSNMTYNTSNHYNRETGSGDQSIWHDFKSSEAGDKYSVKLNDVAVSQSAPINKYKLEDDSKIALDQLMYSDFGGGSSGAEIEAPFVVLNLNAGINTIRITRETGYAVNFKSFVLKTEEVEKSMDFHSVEVKAIENKANFVINYEVVGYSAAEIAAFNPYFDLQKNSYAVTGSWATNIWTRYYAGNAAGKKAGETYDETPLPLVISEANGIMSVAIDISAMDFYKYTTHFDITGTAASDFKPFTEEYHSSVKIDGKKYEIDMFPGSGDGAKYWGCLGLTISDATAKTFAYTGGSALKDGNKAYFVVEGSYENYTAAELEALAIHFDIEANGGHSKAGETTGTKDLSDKATIVVNENGTFQIKVDITDEAPGAYYTHTKLGDQAGNGDIKPNKAIDSKVTIGSKLYNVVATPSGNNGETFWGNLALIIEDTAVAITKGAAAIKCEAEDIVTAASWVNSGFTQGQLVAEDATSGASGNKFITSSTGNASTAKPFQIALKADQAGTMTMKVAYALGTQNTKNKKVDFSYSYSYRLDGEENKLTCVTTDTLAKLPGDWTWVEIEFTFEVTAGTHILEGYVPSQTQTDAGGLPCIDYYTFQLA